MKIYPYEEYELKIYPHMCKECTLSKVCKDSPKYDQKNKCKIEDMVKKNVYK